MYFVMKALAAFFSLFSANALSNLAKALTFLAFDILRFRRALMLANITRAFGDSIDQRRKIEIARISVYHFFQTVFESLISKRLPLAEHVKVQHDEHLLEALKEEKGVFILCFHMGNWEAMASKVSLSYRRVQAVMKPIGSKGLNRFVEETRERNGLYWIKRTSQGDAYRGILKTLKQGEILGFIVDQARPGEPRLPFFGHSAKTNTGLATIWRRHPAPIIPAFIYRSSFGHHVLTFEPALNLPLSADKKADILSHSTLFNQVVERAIRLHPEHYFWYHNRWK